VRPLLRIARYTHKWIIPEYVAARNRGAARNDMDGPFNQGAGPVAHAKSGWLAPLIVAANYLGFGGDGNLNVSTLFEPHIVTMFVG
jgi:hypothetical protein